MHHTILIDHRLMLLIFYAKGEKAGEGNKRENDVQDYLDP